MLSPTLQNQIFDLSDISYVRGQKFTNVTLYTYKCLVTENYAFMYHDYTHIHEKRERE